MISSYDESDLATLKKIIKKYFPKAEIIIFGSRTTGTHKETSDLDICLKADGPLPLAPWSLLEEEISQTDIPYKIDLSDWHRLTPEFQTLILKNGIKK